MWDLKPQSSDSETRVEIWLKLIFIFTVNAVKHPETFFHRERHYIKCKVLKINLGVMKDNSDKYRVPPKVLQLRVGLGYEVKVPMLRAWALNIMTQSWYQCKLNQPEYRWSSERQVIWICLKTSTMKMALRQQLALNGDCWQSLGTHSNLWRLRSSYSYFHRRIITTRKRLCQTIT